MKLSQLIETLQRIQKETKEDIDVVTWMSKHCNTEVITTVEPGWYDESVGDFMDTIGCAENETEINCVLVS